MPLSEHEERLLAQMEEQLSKDDPRLVSTLTGARTRTPRSTLLSISLLLIGFVTLFGGLISQTIPVGVLGFVIALFGIYRLITGFRQPSMKNGFPVVAFCSLICFWLKRVAMHYWSMTIMSPSRGISILRLGTMPPYST